MTATKLSATAFAKDPEAAFAACADAPQALAVQGKVRAYLVSPAWFEHLRAVEDAALAQLADRALAGGTLGTTASQAALKGTSDASTRPVAGRGKTAQKAARGKPRARR